jgi:hypothetical protein
LVFIFIHPVLFRVLFLIFNKVPLTEAAIHWCDGAVEGKRLAEPPSPGSPIDALTQFAVTAASSSADVAIYTMGSAMESAAECATYSQAVGSAALEVAAYSSKNVGNAAGAAAGAAAAASAAGVSMVTKNVVPSSWLLRLGYDLAAGPQFHPGKHHFSFDIYHLLILFSSLILPLALNDVVCQKGHEVEFESDLMKGSVFVALKRDANLDPKTHNAFFDGKGRTVQIQWSITLKRKLRGPLFIGFESNQSRQTGSLPVCFWIKTLSLFELLNSICFTHLLFACIVSVDKPILSLFKSERDNAVVVDISLIDVSCQERSPSAFTFQSKTNKRRQ